MNTIIKLPKEEWEILLHNTAAKCGLSECIVEKDFGVCWILDYLFHRSPWAKNLAFKGGSSLSKCFDLIHHFSEDIDLILNWRLWDAAKDDLRAEHSKSQQDKLNKVLNAETEVFLRDVFIPKLKEDLSQCLTKTLMFPSIPMNLKLSILHIPSCSAKPPFCLWCGWRWVH